MTFSITCILFLSDPGFGMQVRFDLIIILRFCFFLQMTQAKMLKRPLKKKPVHCKYSFHFRHHPPERLGYISESGLTSVHSFSPFQSSMEPEENSPSASTPTSPQTKTASEGELSTTAAELLQDYMTTVCDFHFLTICAILYETADFQDVLLVVMFTISFFTL